MKNYLPKTKFRPQDNSTLTTSLQHNAFLKDIATSKAFREKQTAFLNEALKKQGLEPHPNKPKYTLKQLEAKLNKINHTTSNAEEWEDRFQETLKIEKAQKEAVANCYAIFQWLPVKPRTSGTHFIANNETEFNRINTARNKALQDKKADGIQIIQMKYLNWSVETTRALAGMYCYGIRVILGNATEVKSPRYPRPYIKEGTPEVVKAVKKVQSIQNNKTCNAFIKEVARLLTKGYKINPINVDVDYGFVVKKRIPAHTITTPEGVNIKVKAKWKETMVDSLKYNMTIHPKFPQTSNIAYFVEGVEDALCELRPTKHYSEKQKVELENLRQLYCEGTDFNRHSATQHIHYSFKTETENFDYYTGNTYYTEKDQEVSTILTDEVFTWKEGFRTSKNNQGESYTSKVLYPYQSDIKTTYDDMGKMTEMEEALKWLKNNDILDLHTYHCPNCGNLANSYEGCNHCGYELPKEAVADFNNGRLTREELASMSVSEIEEQFKNDETEVSYEEWRSNEVEDIDETDEENLDIYSLETDYE